MGLYPTTMLDAATAALDDNLLASGSLVAIPIDMTVTQMTQIILAQLSSTQDYSMRAWLSEFVEGLAIPPGIFPVLRSVGLPVVIHTAAQTPPDNSFGILVQSASYILNILNLTNEANVFGFSKTDLA